MTHEVTIFHNPNCGSSKSAVRIAEELGVPATVVNYQRTPPDRAMLESIVARLEDPVADLVRKDARFHELGLEAADYTEPGPVIDLLLQHKMLMQRPIVVKGDRAIIGRPGDRVREVLS